MSLKHFLETFIIVGLIMLLITGGATIYNQQPSYTQLTGDSLKKSVNCSFFTQYQRHLHPNHNCS